MPYHNNTNNNPMGSVDMNCNTTDYLRRVESNGSTGPSLTSAAFNDL